MKKFNLKYPYIPYKSVSDGVSPIFCSCENYSKMVTKRVKHKTITEKVNFTLTQTIGTKTEDGKKVFVAVLMEDNELLEHKNLSSYQEAKDFCQNYINVQQFEKTKYLLNA